MTPERWQQIETLYHSARERAPADRAALLAQADPELRREVEAMLVQDGSGGKILDRPAVDLLPDSTLTQVMLGSQLGPYKIEGVLGEGGMGRVYRAVDTRLDRKVAIKVSARQFSERFEREARSIAALNHPHICTLYDVGPNYLVMELVEGETLAARLKKGKLSIAETARYGAQIADALAAAQEKGIIHRDLKPANVMLTKSGVKVLDFGLAKSERDDTLTAANAVMGTPAYMAPEQREGKECDARTDIYALGLVLREMTAELPPHLTRVVERCQAPEPENRWHSARDVQFQLEAGGAEGVAQAESLPHRRLPWAVAAVAVLVAAIGWWYATRPVPLRPLVSLNLDLPDETPLANGSGGGHRLALSPDGSRLALTLRGTDGKVRLYTRRLDQNQVTPLTGTDDASLPFFSPDGRWIGFYAEGKLKKIAIGGGPAITLCDAPAARGASWGDDGNIIAALFNNGGLSRIPSAGGTPVPVTKLNSGENRHLWPQVLPGSQTVLFTAGSQFVYYDDSNTDVVSLKTGERKTVQRGGFFGRFVATSDRTGYLVYLRRNMLFAAPFDPRRLTLDGAPQPVLENISNVAISGGEYAFTGAASDPGTFVYLAGKDRGGDSFLWLDKAGKTESLYAPIGLYTTPRFSPDGKRLAFAVLNGTGADIWVKDVDRDAPSRLTFLAGVNRWPLWTTDGKGIVFQSGNPPAVSLYWIRSDGSGDAQRLTDVRPGATPFSFSPDGKRLAFHAENAIFTAPVEGDPGQPMLGKPELFLKNGLYPAFSPDGRWLAYASNESGTLQVYVRPFPGPGGRWQISTGGGTLPVWSRGGRELLFENLDERVMAVSYSAKGDSFAAGKPGIWSEARLRALIGNISNYDLTPDGKRLAAMLTPVDEPARLTVLLNFFDELRRRAPAGN